MGVFDHVLSPSSLPVRDGSLPHMTGKNISPSLVRLQQQLRVVEVALFLDPQIRFARFLFYFFSFRGG